MCSHISLKEKNSCFKSGETKNRKHCVHAHLFLHKPKEIFSASKSMVTRQQQSTKSSMKDVNLGTITDTLWYKFSPLSGIRAKPKLHRRRRRIYESFQSRRRSHTANLSKFGKHCEELPWESSSNYTSSIRDKRNCRTSCTSSRRGDISRIIATSIGFLSSVGRILWNAVAICEMTKTFWQTGHLKMNEDLGNPRAEFGKKIF